MNMFPLEGRSKKQIEDEAIETLIELGYRIYKPLSESFSVHSLNDLVRYYYDKLERYRPSRKLGYSSNIKRDRGVAKRMIESRQSLGCSKSRAITECCILIDILFKDDTHGIQASSMPILDPNGACSWVMDRLVKMFYEREETNEQAFRAELSEAQESLDIIDLKVEKRIEEYGQKEKIRR